VSGFVLIFIEIPLLLRICPTSSKFDAFIRRFTTNYMRAAVYAIMSVVQWLSIIVAGSSLIAAAVVLLIAAAFYALAGLKHQDFVGSKTLGGQGVAQMIIWGERIGPMCLETTEDDSKPRILLFKTSLNWLSCISTAYMSLGPVVQASCIGSGRSV
jgi:hypothetical protein